MIGKSNSTRDELEGVIAICRAVQVGRIEPFSVDLDYMLEVIRRHYPDAHSLQEFCVDAEAIKGLSSVLQRQNEWIQHQSTTLYKDPFLLNQQLMRMDVSSIAEAYLKSWHPLVQIEQVSAKTLVSSLGYWTNLIPFAERWKESDLKLVDAGTATHQEARELGIISEEGFAEKIESFWRELIARVGDGVHIKYWEWIGADTYEETVRRAFLTVFIVSYGYAKIVYNRVEEEISLFPNREPNPESNEVKISIPTLIDYQEWKQWQRE